MSDKAKAQHNFKVTCSCEACVAVESVLFHAIHSLVEAQACPHALLDGVMRQAAIIGACGASEGNEELVLAAMVRLFEARFRQTVMENMAGARFPDGERPQ